MPAWRPNISMPRICEILGGRCQEIRRSGEIDWPRPRLSQFHSIERPDPPATVNRGEQDGSPQFCNRHGHVRRNVGRRPGASRKTNILRMPSRWSTRSRPAASATPSRARSTRRWRRSSSSRSCSKTRPAPPARSARNLSPPPSRMATRCLRTSYRFPALPRSTNCSAGSRNSPMPTSSRWRVSSPIRS